MGKSLKFLKEYNFKDISRCLFSKTPLNMELFELKTNYKRGGGVVRSELIKVSGIGVYGKTIGKDKDYVHNFVTKIWRERDYDVRVVDFWQITGFLRLQNLMKMEELMMMVT